MCRITGVHTHRFFHQCCLRNVLRTAVLFCKSDRKSKRSIGALSLADVYKLLGHVTLIIKISITNIVKFYSNSILQHLYSNSISTVAKTETAIAAGVHAA